MPLQREDLQCDRCAGVMRCEGVVSFWHRGMSTGEEARHRCDCGATLVELDSLRWKVELVRAGGLAVILVILGYYGIHIAVGVLRSGYGGNDPSAIWIVLVLFLVASFVGGPLVALRMRARARDRGRRRHMVIAGSRGAGERPSI